ncbi:MAG: hypothetical protein IPH22_06485 [Nitrosomonas sp.]|nr:hypothetical protein [Nitrosomonas sp.]
MNEALDPETKRIIERFNNRSTAAVRVLAIWVPALVLLWLSGLEPRFSASTSYVTTKANYFRDAERMDTRKKVLAEYDDTQLDERLKDRIELLKTRKDELRTVAEVPFQLPGGINVPVRVVWAPTLWVFLAFGTLIFLLNQRSVLSGLSARAGQ